MENDLLLPEDGANAEESRSAIWTSLFDITSPAYVLETSEFGAK